MPVAAGPAGVPSGPGGIAMGLFQTTRWSLILAGRQDAVALGAAFAHLCEAYRHPVLVYLRRRGYRDDESQDLAQSFFTMLIERRIDVAADPARGRFRQLVLTALKRFLSNAEASRRAERRGGTAVHVPIDGLEMQAAGDGDPERAFERAWAVALLERAMAALEAESHAAGKADLFAGLRPFLVEPPTGDEYARAGAARGMRPNTVAVAVHRLRRRLRELVRVEIGEIVSCDDEVEAELAALREAMGGAIRRRAGGHGRSPARQDRSRV